MPLRMSNPTHPPSDSLSSLFSSVAHHSLRLFPFSLFPPSSILLSEYLLLRYSSPQFFLLFIFSRLCPTAFIFPSISSPVFFLPFSFIHPTPLLRSYPFLHLSFHSLTEQPVDHSLPISWLLPDQQLRIQLPTQMAPQPNHQPGERGLSQMVS